MPRDLHLVPINIPPAWDGSVSLEESMVTLAFLNCLNDEYGEGEREPQSFDSCVIFPKTLTSRVNL